MKKWLVLSGIVLVMLAFKRASDGIDREEIRSAITKSLPLLQSSSHTFLVNAGGCHSCHGQALSGIAFSLAREKGFAVADSSFDEAIASITDTWGSRKYYLAQNDDPAAIVIGGGYDLWALAASKIKSDKNIELLAKNILHRQRSDGSWVSPNERPPLEYYSFTATALAVKGIQAYLPRIFDEQVQQQVTKARTWLMKTIPVANEEKTFQLLGLTWTKADPSFIQQQAKKLIASQHSDGGWSQLDSLSSDSYATGQSLYALYLCGALPTASRVYQQGLAFLVRNQQQDGSWKVKTRSFPSVPYVDSGFPHGVDQFISAAGSNWATMALLVGER